VIVPDTAAEVAFVAVNAGRLPLPLAGKPIPGFEFVQLYVAPDGVLVNAVAGIVVPEQTVEPGGTVTVTPGETVTTKVMLTGVTQADRGVPLRVYVVVLAGLAVTLEPVVEDKPVPGLQFQVKSFTMEPCTAMVAGAPEHIFTVSV
jgi:hypothetical protein